jgi:hypothetical protein
MKMDVHSSLRLNNDASRIVGEWWSWSVWLEGSDEALDQVASVRYTLHPTFPNPVREVSDRASKFKLLAGGWGEFAVEALVRQKVGDEIALERWITFSGSGEEAGRPTEASRRPRIFLSYGATDEPLVRILRRGVEAQGVDIFSPDDLKERESWPETIRHGMQQADLLVVSASGELRGFAELALAHASLQHKPIVPVLVGDASEPPKQFQDLQYVRLKSREQASAIGDLIAARAKDNFYED